MSKDFPKKKSFLADKKMFELHFIFSTKSNAKTKANSLKRKGFLVRTVSRKVKVSGRTNKQTRYALYKRKK